MARGLGFAKTETKNGVEYTTIRWDRVFAYLDEIGFDHNWSKEGFIPENVFYRLAMKAKNEAAEAFQAKIADEVIPSIRRTGGYIAGQAALSREELMARALLTAQKALEERDAKISALAAANRVLEPKAGYFDDLVDRNLNTGLRETAKVLSVKERAFIRFLLEKRYIYRDKKGNLTPYAHYMEDLFVLKECFNEKTSWCGTQILVTPKGRETFRLLCRGL